MKKFFKRALRVIGWNHDPSDSFFRGVSLGLIVAYVVCFIILAVG